MCVERSETFNHLRRPGRQLTLRIMEESAMRVLFAVALSLPLIACAAGSETDAATACAAQGHEPGTEAWRVCMDAGGAAIATGPGSPYANADEEESDR